MFSFFKKNAVLAGAMGAFTQAGFKDSEKKILTDVLITADMHYGICNVKIPQALKSVISAHLSAMFALEHGALETQAYPNQLERLRGAIGIQINLCTHNEKDLAISYLATMLTILFQEEISLNDVFEMYMIKSYS